MKDLKDIKRYTRYYVVANITLKILRLNIFDWERIKIIS